MNTHFTPNNLTGSRNLSDLGSLKAIPLESVRREERIHPSELGDFIDRARSRMELIATDPRYGASFVFSLLDLTTLEATDSPRRVNEIAKRAVFLHGISSGEISPAAICVYPSLAPWVANEIGDTPIKLATVAAFPHGQTSPVPDIKLGLMGGATEFDPVFPIGRFGDPSVPDEAIVQELFDAKAEALGFPIKVILQTGKYNLKEESDREKLQRSCEVAIAARADFLKTSTGKEGDIATPEAVVVLATAILNHYEIHGEKVGLKISGGVKNQDDARFYIALVREILGEEWMNKSLLRFGASSLSGELLDAVVQGGSELGETLRSHLIGKDYFSRPGSAY